MPLTKSNMPTNTSLSLIVCSTSILYVFINRRKIKQFYKKVRNIKKESSKEVIHQNSHVALVYIQDTCTIARDFNNQFINWDYNTLKASMEMLDQQCFFMIRRDVIININAIDEIVKENGRLRLILNPSLNVWFLVAKKRTVAFKRFAEQKLQHKIKTPWRST